MIGGGAIRALAPLRHGSFPWLALVAVAGLAGSQVLTATRVLPGFCGTLSPDALGRVTIASLRSVGVGGIALGWALMVVAMMPPLVSPPLNHVTVSSLKSRRRRAGAIFLTGYGAIWLAAGLAIVPLALAVRLAFGDLAFPYTLVAASIWSCSPLAQLSRNRCHRLARIGLRGVRADADCLRQATTIGPWCILSCGPWMLAVMTLETGHVVAMALVTLALVLDRMMPTRRPEWRLPPAIGAFRLRRSPKRSSVDGSCPRR